MNILVAGFGNVLREDDAFGIRLLERLRIRATEFPSVRFFEAGIGGINFVQELQDGFDALIVLDALEAEDQAAPGTVRVLEAQVLDPRQMPVHVARDALADIHYAEPGRAMALAKALDRLPAKSFIVGCVALRCELGLELTPLVEAALPIAEIRVAELIEGLLTQHTSPTSEHFVMDVAQVLQKEAV